ncbi:ATP-binding cassette domain-containing protein [Nakamurella sp. DB0629]|uniref:ATP-binding cassette domain-containing protein n=1 Tax=Nakamurella aerolata TaxID=1656892 RepID=A0A849ABY2_9ACTN|nr:ATP-binding cassette domain-containing protein [Nakamurella aerolata]
MQALRGIDLEIPAGSFTAVMGPSGSGKTTLLHCAAGLQQPTGGSVVLAGKELVFADEPTGALDLRSAREVLALLRGLADAGQTIGMVTHDPSAAAYSDQVLFLADGSIVDRLPKPNAGAVAARMASLVERVESAAGAGADAAGEPAAAFTWRARLAQGE